MYIRIYICIYKHIYTYVYTHICIYTHTICIRTQYICIYIHTYIYAHTHVHMYNIYTYTCIQGLKEFTKNVPMEGWGMKHDAQLLRAVHKHGSVSALKLVYEALS